MTPDAIRAIANDLRAFLGDSEAFDAPPEGEIATALDEAADRIVELEREVAILRSTLRQEGVQVIMVREGKR